MRASDPPDAAAAPDSVPCHTRSCAVSRRRHRLKDALGHRAASDARFEQHFFLQPAVDRRIRLLIDQPHAEFRHLARRPEHHLHFRAAAWPPIAAMNVRARLRQRSPFELCRSVDTRLASARSPASGPAATPIDKLESFRHPLPAERMLANQRCVCRYHSRVDLAGPLRTTGSRYARRAGWRVET